MNILVFWFVFKPPHPTTSNGDGLDKLAQGHPLTTLECIGSVVRNDTPSGKKEGEKKPSAPADGDLACYQLSGCLFALKVFHCVEGVLSQPLF